MCITAEIYTDPRMEIWQGFDLNDPVITPTDGQHIYLSNYVERFPFWYIVSNTCIWYNSYENLLYYLVPQNEKPSEGTPGVFLFHFIVVAYSTGWSPTTCHHPTICWCSGTLHQPWQRLQNLLYYPFSHLLSVPVGGGNTPNIAHIVLYLCRNLSYYICKFVEALVIFYGR